MQRFAILAAAVAAFFAGAAHAAPVTSLAGATVYSFGNSNQFTAGPVAVAAGINWSSDSNVSVYGYTGGYGFNTNGDWDGLSMIGTNNGTGTMRIDFNSSVAGVGAFLNWSRFNDDQPDGDPATISIYDPADTLLESFTLTFGPLGGTNNGEFHGFLRNTADIASIRFSGAYIGAADLSVLAVNSVPVPGTLALGALGLLAMGALRRRKA